MSDGLQVGVSVGLQVGVIVGVSVGMRDGASVGMRDGVSVGVKDGVSDSSTHSIFMHRMIVNNAIESSMILFTQIATLELEVNIYFILS